MSIGKYCSSNLGNEGLFDMYSIDGHAAFRFKSDGCGKNGVAGFSYQLKSYDQQYRGIYGRSICYRWVLKMSLLEVMKIMMMKMIMMKIIMMNDEH